MNSNLDFFLETDQWSLYNSDYEFLESISKPIILD